MKIDLRKLFTYKNIDIDNEVIVPVEYYKTTDIIRISPLSIKGNISLNYEDEIELNVSIKGTFILACAISLEEVSYDFATEVNEIIPENDKKSNLDLELLDILWENTVLEVPIKVIKEGASIKTKSGNGWELEK